MVFALDRDLAPFGASWRRSDGIGSVGGSTILDGLTLNVHEGEIFLVIGPNGAGKSTLLRCLMRIENHRGTVRVQGRDLRSYGQRELAGLMSYVPQHDCEAIGYSAFEFVLMARYAHFQPFRSASRLLLSFRQYSIRLLSRPLGAEQKIP